MKVVLREVRTSDLPILFEQQKDPEANFRAAFTPKNPSDREAFAKKWDRMRTDPTVTVRTIVVDGGVAGSIASWIDSDWRNEPEVTYWIGRDFWGAGVATRALARFVRSIQKRRPLYGRAAGDNAASIRVLEKCGFKAFGDGRGFANARGVEIGERFFVLE